MECLSGAHLISRSRVFYPAVFAAMLLAGISDSRSEDAGSVEHSALFQKLDKNGDGQLTKGEVPQEQSRFFERIVRLGDKNSDGILTKDEFQKANTLEDNPHVSFSPVRDKRPGDRGDMRQKFERLDRNKDGKISLEEVPEKLRDRIKPLFDRAGKTGMTEKDWATFAGQMIKPATESSEQGRPRQGRNPKFLRLLDVNQDRRISKVEWAQLSDKFEELDTNHDGELDMLELNGADRDFSDTENSSLKGKRGSQEDDLLSQQSIEGRRRPTKELP